MYKKLLLTALFAAVVLVTTTAAGPVEARVWAERPHYVEGEVLVRFHSGTEAAQVEAFHAKYGTQTLQHFSLNDVHHLRLPAGLTVTDAIAQMEREVSVQYAEPNGLYYTNDTFPNDQRFNEMYGLHNTGQTGGAADADIDAPEAWDITTGSQNVVVAVIDSGMDLNHPDLVDNLYTNPNEIPNNGNDDDGNGYVDDVNGWDFRDNDNNPNDNTFGCVGHGTHTAGTVGAVGNNGIGVTGVAWDVQIMPLRAFYPFLIILCTAQDADLIEAIQYHTLMDVRVSSNSWGGGGFNQAMYDAIAASNSLFVAAAGNGGLDGIGDNNDNIPNYPSNYDLPNIIAVAATDDEDQRATFSNFGPTTVDVAAPGENILSTLNDIWGDYGELSGTSMATPHVAGLAALILSADSDLTNDQVKSCILDGVDDLGLPILTGGRINAHTSLTLCSAPAIMASFKIRMGWEVINPNEVAAQVRVGDPNAQQVVAGATVFADFTLPDGTVSTSAVTAANGWASFQVSSSGGGNCTITVTDITHPDYTFDPNIGIVTQTIPCP